MSIRTLLRLSREGDGSRDEPDERCLSCGVDLTNSRSFATYRVCHSCGRHFQVNAWERMATLLDPGTFRELDRGVSAIDPLSFRGRRSYRSHVIESQRRTGLSEAVLSGTGRILGNDVSVAVLDFGFAGGSIGVVAGERIARAMERAADRNIPFISVCTSSGTRLQEGLLALMQTPRIAVAAERQRARNVPWIAIVADPTTGPAYAGFANQADIIIGEPGALVGFAPLRELEEREGGEMDPSAHRTEGHLARGLIDAIVPRDKLRDTIGQLVALMHLEYRLAPAESAERDPARTPMTAWSEVQISRHRERPTSREFIARMSPAFFEIRGDRARGDDPAVVAGIGTVGGEAVAIVGQQRHNPATDEPQYIRPAGFAKAARTFRLASKLGLPVVTLVDTHGVQPGLDSEEAGLGAAIAGCVSAMLDLRTASVAVILGEGASEAAMAMAVADRVLMLEHAVYEVIAPEEAARILFQERDRASEAASRLRLTSLDCLNQGVVDEAVEEPGDGAHSDPEAAAVLTERAILRALARLNRQRAGKRQRARLARYRQTGKTRSWVLGTLDRRWAHLVDRIAGAWNRVRRRSPVLRKWSDAVEEFDIAV